MVEEVRIPDRSLNPLNNGVRMNKNRIHSTALWAPQQPEETQRPRHCVHPQALNEAHPYRARRRELRCGSRCQPIRNRAGGDALTMSVKAQLRRTTAIDRLEIMTIQLVPYLPPEFLKERFSSAKISTLHFLCL